MARTKMGLNERKGMFKYYKYYQLLQLVLLWCVVTWIKGFSKLELFIQALIFIDLQNCFSCQLLLSYLHSIHQACNNTTTIAANVV